MKKILSVLLCAVMIFSFSAFAFADESADIVIDGDYVIVYGDEKLTAVCEKLSEYINNVIGKRLTVASVAEGKSITVTTDKSEIENGYIIKTVGENVAVTGSTLQQTVRGVYAFLEKYCGIRCYTSKLTVYKQDKIILPADLEYSYTPFFEFTDTDWMSPSDIEYSLFNGLNSDEYRHIPDEFGGTIDYISSMAHSLTNQFCDKNKYFEEHPEYYAFDGIKRNSKQLCLSNPDVLEIVRNEVFELLENRHNPDVDLQIISLSQADNIAYCRCDGCKKIDRKCGSHAGTYILFVNEIARSIKEKGYDNVLIDTFAYRYTRAVPKGLKIEPNVCVRLCSIECCFSHTLDDPSCKTNAEFMHDLHEWSKICNRLYVWDYCTNYCAFVGIFPNFGVLQRNMQIFYENNVKGVYEEGNYTMDVCDTEFGELRSYLISKLFQNPYLDFNAVRDEFLDAYYGGGAEYIGEFLDLITQNAGEKHLGIYQPMSKTLSLSSKQVKSCDELWEKAIASSEGEAKENVLNSELCWRYWKMKNRKSEFSNILKYDDEKARLTEDINSTGIKRWMETDEARSFFSSLFQTLYFDLFFIVNAVLKLLYKA